MRPFGGDEEDRTPDPLLAKQVLSQLSYTPMFGFPSVFQASFCRHSFSLSILKIEQCFLSTCSPLLTEAFELSFVLLRKEVIQPHLPIRLPCYDFTPVINPTLDGVLPKVRRPALGVTDSHGVTGGVYKARERIHRTMTGHDSSRISPFGYPRLSAYLRLPVAFRSLSRPSSAPGAKAFTLRPL